MRFMKKENMEKDKSEKRAKCGYVPPFVEVHGAVPHNLLGISLYGDHYRADDDTDGTSDHARADEDGGVITNAKILGREFSFSDVWEE